MENLSHNSPSFAADSPPSYQRARLFRIYNHYRVVVSVLLVMLLFIAPTEFDTRLRAGEYYQAGIIIYLAINLFIGLILLAGCGAENRPEESAPQPAHHSVSPDGYSGFARFITGQYRHDQRAGKSGDCNRGRR